MLATRAPEIHCPHSARAGSRGRAIERARHEARLLLAHEQLAAPVSSFRMHPVLGIRGPLLELDGAELDAPVLAGLAGGITRVAPAACTLGPAVEERVSALFQEHKPVLAMALDSLATEMLFQLCDRLYARIRREARRHALRAGPPQHPGDAGLALAAQPTVIALSGIDTEAISANAQGMLCPVKSLSFVVALGPRLSVEPFLPRCARCASRDRCHLRPQ
jgi:hypothetical protein